MYLVKIYDGPNDETGLEIHSPYVSDLKLSKAEVNLVIDGISDMSFAINPLNPAWGKIKPLRTLIKVFDLKKNKKIFDGRVLKPVQKMSSDGMFSIEYICECKLGYLNDSNQRHGEYHDISVKDFLQVMINNHNRQVEPHKQFKIGNVTVTDPNDSLYRYLGYEKTFATIKDKLIDRLGGYLVLRDEEDGMYLDYLENVGELKGTPIRLRVNLKEMQREIDPLDVITRVVPLGTAIESEDQDATDASQARLTIAEVNNGVDYLDDPELIEEFGIIEGTIVYDDITVPSILKLRGEQFLERQKAAKITYDITPVDVSLIDESFDSFKVGNWHHIINPVFSINEPLQIIAQKIDLLDPLNASLTIGEKYRTLSQYQADLNKKSRLVEELQSTVSKQSQRTRELLDEISNVKSEVTNVIEIIESTNLEALPEAINALEQAILDLNDALDNIPIYDLATAQNDGLMPKEDKAKVDLITVSQVVNLNDLSTQINTLQQKLNLVTVTQPVDLDDLLSRVQAIEDEIWP